MEYNFAALGLSSDESEEDAPYLRIASIQDKKRAEIRRLEAFRDEKRKELMNLSTAAGDDDPGHQAQLRELSKQVLKLSKTTEEQRKLADELERKLNSMATEAPAIPQVKVDPQTELIKSLRDQTTVLRTAIQKAKRVLSLEGGCKNRARQIKKLKAQLEDLPKVGPRGETPKVQAVDVQGLRNDIAELTRERDSLKLKSKGLLSRVAIFEKGDLKTRVRTNLEISNQNDQIIERLRPKDRKRSQIQPIYRGHVGQQSRLCVIINGLNAELTERNVELRRNKVEPNEAGVYKEIERVQKRLHLLESSLSCLI
jgi:hypothetical protein